jgi:hydrogenase/urease accessory protein HupE
MIKNTELNIFVSVLFCLFIVIAPGLNAFETSTAVLKLDKMADNHLQGSWSIQYADIMRLINVDADGDNEIRWWEVTEQRENIQLLLQQSVRFYSNQDVCKLNMHLLNNEPAALGQMLSIDFTVDCNNRPATDIAYSFLSGIDPLHQCVYEIRQIEPQIEQETLRGILSENNNRVSLMDTRVPKALIDYLIYGIKHIFTGWDHLVFVFLLALATVIAKRKSTGKTVSTNQLVICVSLFTLAHSITLAITTMTNLSVPNRLTEIIIALSVAWTGWLVVKERSAPEYWVVFVFGLVHGLGFSSVLIQWSQTTTSSFVLLLGFNIGIELGLVMCLAAALPAVIVLSRTEIFQQSIRSAPLSLLAVGAACMAGRTLDILLPPVL